MDSKFFKLLIFCTLCLPLLVTGCSWSKNRIKDVKSVFGGNDFDPEIVKNGASSGKQVVVPQKNPLLKEDEIRLASIQQSGPSSSEAVQFQYDYKKAFEKIARKIADLFPAIEGMVINIEKDKLLLSLKLADGVKEGLVMPLVRKGEVFKHPLTGQPLGRLEKVVGRIEIQEVLQDYSTAKILFLREGEEVKPGDMVRIPGLIRLAVFPATNRTNLEIESGLLLTGLVEPLKKTDRFRIYDEDRLKAMILEQGQKVENFRPSDYVDQFHEQVTADYYVVSVIKDLKGEKLVETQVISLSQKKMVNELNAFIEKEPITMVAAPAPYIQGQGGQLPGVPRRPVLIRTNSQREDLTIHKIDLPVLKMASGDVNGDGRSELILISEKQLRIVTWQNDKFIDMYTQRAEVIETFLYVDVADINKNGLPEIYVTNLSQDRLKSFVIEFRNGKFQRIKEDIDSFLHVINIPGKEPLLAAQSLGYQSFFEGPVFRYEWQGADLRKSGAIELPRGVNLFDFTIADIDGDGIEEVLTIAKNNHLRVFSKNIDWESSGYFGGSIQEIKYKAVPDAIARYDIVQNSTGVIKGRILVADLNGDGVPEVVTPRKLVKGGFAYTGVGSSSEYELTNLVWDGQGLVEAWKTTERGGDLIDFQFIDIDGDGILEIVVSNANVGKIMSRREDFLLVYKYRL